MLSGFKNRVIEILKQNKGRLFGLVYVYILVMIIAAGTIYLNNMNAVVQQNIPVKLQDTLIYPADLALIEGKETPPVDVNKISNPNSSLLEKGKEIYSASCASCHGVDGMGDGAAGAVLNPKPRNFKSNEGWKNGGKISQLYKTLQEGIPGTAMAAYDYMQIEDRFAVIHYVRSFMSSPPSDSPAELAELDKKYNLSAGSKAQNQIPVSFAEKILLKENQQVTKRIMQVVNSIENNYSDPGAEIFNKITSNRIRAVTSLYHESDWKKDKETFIALIVNNVIDNGFKSEAARLSQSEWSLLYIFMKKSIEQSGS